MEDELILQQPADRRLGTGNSLPPGPPGAENDAADYETKKSKPERRDSTSRSGRRRSPSHGSSPHSRTRRRSRSRGGRRSPSPLDSRRRRRSPSPPVRRNRYRDYSPSDRRRNMRRSPVDDRRRSGASSGRGYRGYRGGSRSRSRSRSGSPRRKSGGGGSGRASSNRWSPPPIKTKPSSPLALSAPPPPQVSQQPPPAAAAQQPPTQQAPFGAMPPQLYGNEAAPYAPTGFNQFNVPPPQQPVAANFQQPPPQADAYGITAPPPPVFNAAFPPPPVWGSANDAYPPQAWIQPPDNNQLQQIPQQPPTAVPPTAMPPPQLVPPQSQPIQQRNVVDNGPPGTNIETNSKRDAVAQEAENQRDELKRQRSSYLKKTSLLRKELKMLKEQRKTLHKGKAGPPSPTTKGFIDENEKLQNQIEKKLSTIENVIDMLTGIIGEENLSRDDEKRYDDKGDSKADKKGDSSKKHSHKEQQKSMISAAAGGAGAVSERSSRKKKRTKSTSSSGSSSAGSSSSSSSSTSSSSSSEEEENEEDDDDDDDSSPERLKNKAIASMKAKAKDALKREALAVAKLKEEKLLDDKKRFNYVFYDPEMHWCQTCDVFPKTAKDYLNHLHSKEHMDRETIETPWHIDMITDQFPTYDNAPTKRTPIRGLTFFIPASAWFCKLCSVWMGDLHCASTHLKSQLHANKYNVFLEKNPHYEVNWLADRQRVLNERKPLPLPPQITSVSTTAADNAPSKKTKKEEKTKKRKKKGSEKKDKKKKSKRSKKRKKHANTTSTSSDSSSSDSDAKATVKDSSATTKRKSPPPVPIQTLDNPNPAVSIRVAMRKQDLATKPDDDDEAPPPAPRMTIVPPPPVGPHPVPAPLLVGGGGVGAGAPAAGANSGGRLGKWAPAQDSSAKAAAATAPEAAAGKHDDVILQQWNAVQPVISESEKKLLEQLKGKLKNKPTQQREGEGTTPAGATIRSNDANTDRRGRDRDRERVRNERGGDRDRDRDRDDRNDRDRRRRSPFGGGRGIGGGIRSGGGGGGRFRRSRSRSRGRLGSPLGRRRRTRSRSRGRRSRSFDRRRRYSRSRTRSRTRSGSRGRGGIEKPVVKASAEFRPRVPENNKDREKRSTTESKDKKQSDKKLTNSATATMAAAVASGKKLPFIGKMPVFKKQIAGGGQTDGNGGAINIDQMAAYHQADNAQQQQQQQPQPQINPPTQRPQAPTAAQIQMAMMEDAYGNAPPFHPDAGVMMDYEELMPDPMQFVNLMGQAPPPPPPPAAAEGVGMTKQQPVVAAAAGADDAEDDMLPPGVDETEKEDNVAAQPIIDGPLPHKGPLPKDLEEALNIIFPGEKKPEDDEGNGVSDVEAANAAKAKATGETQIIVEQPVMQPEELAKQGIHMVTIEETSLLGMDEASQMTMNEPLVFNKNTNKPVATVKGISGNVVLAAEAPGAATTPAPVLAPQQQKHQVAAEENIKNAMDMQATASKQFNGTTAGAAAPQPVDQPAAVIAANVAAEKVGSNSNVVTGITIPDAKAAAEDAVSNIVYDLDDIPQPPPSPTESEKQRRQEELNDLAMLGIDADDMAAQCF